MPVELALGSQVQFCGTSERLLLGDPNTSLIKELWVRPAEQCC